MELSLELLRLKIYLLLNLETGLGSLTGWSEGCFRGQKDINV